MLRSMFSAISGLRAHQTKMDVTGNNIANVNTVGFKASQTVFQDTLSQVIRGRRRPGGGPRRHQPGAGRPRRQGRRDHHQLDPGRHPDHRPVDRLHDQGDGFFVTRARHRGPLHPRRVVRLRRRAASWSRPTAAILQGWMADADGVVNPNGPIGDLSVPYGQIVNPKQSTTGRRSAATSRPAPRAGDTVADRRHDVRQPGRRAEGLLQLHEDRDGQHLDASTSSTPTARSLVTGADRRRSTPPARSPPRPAPGTLAAFTPPAATYPSWTGPVTVDLAAADPVRRRPARVTAHRARTATRWARCSPSSSATTARSSASTPTACASRIGQLALASSTTPAAWRRPATAPSASATTPAPRRSAWPAPAAAASSTAGALEMSNVDLAEEFTGLIVAQRGFQANSRVITSSDEILQDLVNLKR